MKCPYCKIHYMDDERECPMCGKPNPARWSGKREKKGSKDKQKTHSATPYPAIRHEQTTATARSSKPSRTHTTRTKGKDADKKASARIGIIVSAAVVLISLAPTVIAAVADLADELDLSTAITSIWENEPATEEAVVHADLDYTPPSSAYETVQGDWTCMDTGGYLSLDLDYMDYGYAADDQADLEYGCALLYEVDAYENDNGTTQYGYQVDFYPDWGDYGYSMYLSAADGSDDILMSMSYDENNAPDTDTIQFWMRMDAQNM